MGRLPLVIAAIGCAGTAFGCDPTADKEPPLAPKERSQAVIAQNTASSTPAATTVAATAAPDKVVRTPRQLCSGRLEETGRTVQKGGISRAQAATATALPESLRFGSGITWVNFWAAWCAPCKEEIPRLMAWEKQLKGQGKAFHVAFVSLDDDPRQLQTFLDGQKSDGLRATYWLRDGAERASWLKAVGIHDDPELPAHLLVDAKGEVRCTLRGAVEDADFASLTALLP